MTSGPLPDIPQIGLAFPKSPLMTAAFDYTNKHTSKSMHNHTARTAYWSLILAKKLPTFANVDIETVVLASILHDLGFATSKELLNRDIRFEVDGANIARTWLLERTAETGSGGWDPHRVQLLWDMIALHTTASIALHKQPDVALSTMAVWADFGGPRFSGGEVITLEEYKEVVKLFPLHEFGTEKDLKDTMCGLCRDRTQTTFDNLAAEFGRRFGYDGNGEGREEYQELLNKNSPVDQMIENVKQLEEINRQIQKEVVISGSR